MRADVRWGVRAGVWWNVWCGVQWGVGWVRFGAQSAEQPSLEESESRANYVGWTAAAHPIVTAPLTCPHPICSAQLPEARRSLQHRGAVAGVAEIDFGLAADATTGIGPEVKVALCSIKKYTSGKAGVGWVHWCLDRVLWRESQKNARSLIVELWTCGIVKLWKM